MGLRFVVVDQCPVPSKAAPFVQEAKRRSGQVLQSCYRGIDARAILNRFGKHDQTYLYNGWLRRLPGFNPANPPGFSTHECFNDGPAFPGVRRGGRIPDELVGQDWSNAFQVVQAYRGMGINAALTYPNSVRERQHINIRVVPKNLKPPLRRGDGKVGGHGIRKRVGRMTYRLSWIATPNSKGKGKYLDGRRTIFDNEAERAVKAFQHDHGLIADGIYGEMTEHQLDLAYAHWRKKRATRPTSPTPPKPHVTPSAPHVVKASMYPGIDVSNNNGDVDWNAVVKSGKVFAYIRCTEGLTGHGSEDEFFGPGRLKAMRKAGILPGYYHYGHPQPGRQPKDEARHFFDYAKHAGGWDMPVFLPPMLDMEWVRNLGTGQLQSWCKDFLAELERLLHAEIPAAKAKAIEEITGYDPRHPGIYTGLWFWNPRLGDPTGFGDHPLWLSFYTKPPRIPTLPRSWQKTGLFILQHWDKGSVPGVHGDCDMNILYGHIDTKRLRALL